MKAFILALATALPQYSADQGDIAQKMKSLFQLDAKTSQFLENMYTNTKIKRRYSVLKDVETNLEDGEFFNKDFLTNSPGTKVRNDIYIAEAPKLAKKAAQEVIKTWNRDPKEITHIISVSCTGVMAPGIEFILQQELNLPSTVQRIGLNFMGCFGAFRALAVANSIAKENSKNRILVVCTELCSLHFQVAFKTDILIGNALFADGAAATIVGAQIREQETPLWSIEKLTSHAIENSQDKMTWTISDNGCVMSLSKEIPKIIEQNAPAIISSILNKEDFNNFTWAIHPGGKSIVEAIEKSCCLKKEQTKASWKILNDYGNMSSATFLFVLKELAKNIKEHKNVIGLGFGPGLSLETILLEAVN